MVEEAGVWLYSLTLVALLEVILEVEELLLLGKLVLEWLLVFLVALLELLLAFSPSVGWALEWLNLTEAQPQHQEL